MMNNEKEGSKMTIKTKAFIANNLDILLSAISVFLMIIEVSIGTLVYFILIHTKIAICAVCLHKYSAMKISHNIKKGLFLFIANYNFMDIFIFTIIYVYVLNFKGHPYLAIMTPVCNIIMFMFLYIKKKE